MEVYDESVPADQVDAPKGYTPDRAAQALEALRAKIEGSPEQARLVRFADAAVLCTRLHEIAQRPDLAERLARLPKEEFAPALLDELSQAAWALWHLDLLSVKPAEPTSKARVPAPLWDGVLKTRREMLSVVEFGLRGVDGADATIAGIRQGSGYLDGARDLLHLAELYRDYAPLLAARLPQDFRIQDADTATRQADELRVALGLRPVGTAGDDTGRRVWGFTVRVFGEVRAALQYLLRGDPAALATLPKLVSPRRVATRAVADPEPKPTV